MKCSYCAVMPQYRQLVPKIEELLRSGGLVPTKIVDIRFPLKKLVDLQDDLPGILVDRKHSTAEDPYAVIRVEAEDPVSCLFSIRARIVSNIDGQHQLRDICFWPRNAEEQANFARYFGTA